VAIYWGGAIIALLTLLPAALAAAYLLGFGACDRPDTATIAPICSPIGRLSLSGVLIVGVLLLYLPWVRFLKRQLNIQSQLRPSPYISSPLPAAMSGKEMSLPLGQELVVGRIESIDHWGRTILFAGNVLTLWSLYPFQKGWIKQGDRLVLVYQRIPFSKLRFALAFWNGPANPVRGVAAITQSLSLLIAAACIGIFSVVPAPLLGLWITVCILGAIMSSVYLALMLRAKAAVRSFIPRDGSTS
jgi:hypothetical protein